MSGRPFIKNLSVSIIIPAQNEEKNISQLITSIENTFSPRDFEIVLVNDNSDDKTGEIAEQLSTLYKNIQVVHRTEKPGFGRALKAGFKLASKNVLIPMMGDNCDDPKDALKMLEEIEKGYDFVVGTRYKSGTVAGMSIVKRIASQGFTLFSNSLGVPMSDICNAFKAYRSYVIKRVNPKSDGFQILVELPLTAYLLGYRFKEIPVSWKTKRQSRKRSVLRRGPQYLKKFLSIATKFKFKRII
ncbi:MAG: glycosyltransferase family 2 protein [Promethearchaeota archaeon]